MVEDTEKNEKPKKKRVKAQEFVVKKTFRLGSNKDGSPKEHYVKGKTVSLSDKKKIQQLQNLKVI